MIVRKQRDKAKRELMARVTIAVNLDDSMDMTLFKALLTRMNVLHVNANAEIMKEIMQGETVAAKWRERHQPPIVGNDPRFSRWTHLIDCQCGPCREKRSKSIVLPEVPVGPQTPVLGNPNANAALLGTTPPVVATPTVATQQFAPPKILWTIKRINEQRMPMPTIVDLIDEA